MTTKINGKGLGVKLQSNTILTSLLAATVAMAGVVPAYASIDNTATVTGTAPGGVVDDITDTDSESVAVEAPDRSFTLVKTVTSVDETVVAPGGQADVGDLITFQYILTNNGNISLDGAGLTITDPGPTFNGLTGGTLSAVTLTAATDVGSDDVVSPGEAWTYTATYALTQADINNGAEANAAALLGSFTNTVDTPTINTTEAVPVAAVLDAGNSDLTADGTITINPSLALAKVAYDSTNSINDGSTTPYEVGDVITYNFEVTNNGNVEISNITVTDTTFSGAGTLGPITCPVTSDATISAIAPSVTVTCTADYTVVEGDI